MSVDFKSWLQSHGLMKYESLFSDNAIDQDVLLDLTDDDLKSMGIPLGDRKRMLKGIREVSAQPLAGGTNTAVPSGDSRPERRQVTVLMCDLVNSTGLSRQFDAEEFRQIVLEYLTCCEGLIEDHQGTLCHRAGDGVLAIFGFPRTNELIATEAVRTGLEIIKSVERLRPFKNVTLKSRVGIATGITVVGDIIGEGLGRELTVWGDTPNLAARLMAIGKPGTVITSAVTRKLTRRFFEFSDLGEHSLKGFEDPIPAWQVVNELAIGSRSQAVRTDTGLSPLVGRKEETSLLARRWEKARSGAGQVVAISGEPGIGKSRLVQGFKEQLAGEPHREQDFYCSPVYQNSAFYPILDEFSRGAGFDTKDSSEEKLDKLKVMLSSISADAVSNAPVMADLLSIPVDGHYPITKLGPHELKRKALGALHDHLAWAAEDQPVLMVFEDVHWCDPTTFEWIDRIIDCIEHLPVMLILTHRPEFTPRWSKHYVTRQQIMPLDPVMSRSKIIEELGRVPSLPEPVVAAMMEKTDGNPLFIEEFCKAVAEAGDPSGTVDGDPYSMLHTHSVPSTLADSLMSRLDRLGPSKHVAQVAAALGREFSRTMIAAVADFGGDELSEALDNLVAADIIQQSGSDSPRLSYRFKHALLQDAAHSSMLKTESQHLHARIGKHLEDTELERADREPELFAFHFTQGDMPEKARYYWQKAGDGAIRRLGYTAQEVVECYSHARSISETLGDSSKVFPALRGLWVYHFIKADLDKAKGVAFQLLDLSKRTMKTNEQSSADDAGDLLIEAQRSLGMTCLYLGEYDAARDHIEQAIALYDHQRHASHLEKFGVDPWVVSASYRAHVLWFLGQPDEALKQSTEVLTVARDMDNPFVLTGALAFAAYLQQHLQDAAATKKLASEAIVLAEKYGFPFWVQQQRILKGWAMAELGDVDDGMAMLERGLATYQEMGARLALPWFLSLSAETLAKLGRIDDAVRTLRAASAIADTTGENFYLAEIQRLEGQLILSSQASNAADRAEVCFRRAIETASERNARAIRAKAARSLADLLERQGRGKEAQQIIADATYSNHLEHP
ncbi:MAG: adenylate/guanylate cyclase domain-containing protein [Pseudomonadota bacterium]